MTFAVIETGGKQYKIAEGDVIRVEKLPEVVEGAAFAFDKVLLIDDGAQTTVGAPYIAGKKVEAEHIAEGKGKKILVQKFKSKSRYTRRYGHRQPYSEVKITKIA